jgi:acetylornithine deacetylase/succinyl-diaminopimelate desuccinylase-like protein
MTTSAGYDPAAEVVDICSDLIAIDTSNYGDEPGPGERKAAEHVAQLLDDVGIVAEVFESEPGRTSLVARWGGGAGEPVLVHGHLDVVPAAADDWSVHPFSGEVRDGVVWGRGAVDMKDFDAMLLSSVRARARAGVVPSRPLVLCFTADEEAGGAKGAGHLVRHHRDQLEDCTVAIGEVGGFSVTARGRRVYLVEAAERGMAWVRLTAHGTAGHGSMRHPDNAVTRLAAAVARIGQHQWPVRLTPTMEVLLAAVAELAGTEATPANAESLIDEFGSAARMIGAGLRSSANPTMLEAGYKVNVVPGSATAYVDGRFLPGYRDEFLETIDRLLGPKVTREFVSFGDAPSAPLDSPFFDQLCAALVAEDPAARPVPYVMAGGTDAKSFADLGIKGYGFAPLMLTPDLDYYGMFHGVDERVPVEGLEFGVRVLDRLLAS